MKKRILGITLLVTLMGSFCGCGPEKMEMTKNDTGFYQIEGTTIVDQSVPASSTIEQ